jgi:hypothetical protein
VLLGCAGGLWCPHTQRALRSHFQGVGFPGVVGCCLAAIWCPTPVDAQATLKVVLLEGVEYPGVFAWGVAGRLWCPHTQEPQATLQVGCLGIARGAAWGMDVVLMKS